MLFFCCLCAVFDAVCYAVLYCSEAEKRETAEHEVKMDEAVTKIAAIQRG